MVSPFLSFPPLPLLLFDLPHCRSCSSTVVPQSWWFTPRLQCRLPLPYAVVCCCVHCCAGCTATCCDQRSVRLAALVWAGGGLAHAAKYARDSFPLLHYHF